VLQNEVSDATNLASARAARRVGALVCLNAAPARPLGGELGSLVDILVANAVEAEMLSGVVVDSLESARRAAAALRSPTRTAIVTAGGDGVAAASQDGDLALPAIPVTVVSTHGAGDVFVGVLAAGIAARHSLQEALAQANRAAASHVSSR
jgi:ribokinase